MFEQEINELKMELEPIAKNIQVFQQEVDVLRGINSQMDEEIARLKRNRVKH